MRLKVLKLKPSKNPISQTQLSRFGIWNIGDDPELQAYELVIDFYVDDVLEKTLLVSEKYYDNALKNNSMDDLYEGVKIDSLLSIISSIGIDGDVLFEEEVAETSRKIVDDIFGDKAAPPNAFALISKHIMGLRDKFKIQPK